jgi:hypothetical protein
MRAAALTIGVVAPAVLIVGCLSTAAVQGRAGELRLSLLRLTAEVRQFPLRIGGDASRDDLIAPRLPAGFATVEPDLSTGGDAPPLALIIAGSDAAPSQVVIGLRQGRRLTWPTALPFAEGDAVCVQSPCERDGAAWASCAGGSWFRPTGETARSWRGSSPPPARRCPSARPSWRSAASTTGPPSRRSIRCATSFLASEISAPAAF